MAEQNPTQSRRRVTLNVDLTGSNCGPDFLGVELVLAPPEDWTDERIRQGAADHYAVPLDQVAEPVELGGAHDHSCCAPEDCCGGPCAAHPCWDLTT